MNTTGETGERPIKTAPRRPDWRFVWRHPAHIVALGFGSGLAPKAPGTVGTLWAWLVFDLFAPRMSESSMGWTILASLVLGIWVCTVTAQHLNLSDPSSVVWDEVVAFWIVLWLITPASFGAQLVAFLLFRVFDAVKPGPVAWADEMFKAPRGHAIGWRQGVGILFDDLVAALCTLLVISMWRRW